MNPTQDPTVIIAALATTFAFVITLAFLYRARAASQRKEAQVATRVTEAERARRAIVSKQEAELEKAVLAGTHLLNGLPRCQASPSCFEAATRPKPRIVRDEGVIDFVRRFFGAPRRYRMVEPHVFIEEAFQETGLISAFIGFFVAMWRGEPKKPEKGPPLRYCDIHVHVARQVCLEQLSADEHAEASAQRDREVGLSYFEAAGMEKRVIKLVTETELREADKKRRKAPDTSTSNVVQATFGAGRSVANGASAGDRPS